MRTKLQTSMLIAAALSLDVIASPVDKLNKVGEGEMAWLFFTLYHATLYSHSGDYQPGDYPQALQLRYARDIDKQHLVEATAEQWQHQGLTRNEYGEWLMRLHQIWPDVQQGDQLTFQVDERGQGQFFHNDKPIGLVRSTAFSEAFLNIWLSEKTSQPQLRTQLIGGVR